MHRLQRELLQRRQRDVIAEYHFVYETLNIPSEWFWLALEPLIRDIDRDPDRLADAVKEYVVRAADRGVPGKPRAIYKDLIFTQTLLAGFDNIRSSALAARFFGTAAEDLGTKRIQLLARNITNAMKRGHRSIKGALNEQE